MATRQCSWTPGARRERCPPGPGEGSPRFSSTFVLITENRMAQLAERRAELDLQISLLAKHEVTRLLSMVEAIGNHMGVQVPEQGLEELKKDVAPEQVLDELEHASEPPPH
jgi:uncharacterized membrane protein